MPKVTLQFDCGNAAFEDYPDELRRIFREAGYRAEQLRADALATGEELSSAPLFDTNGNRVGEVTYHHKED